MNIYDAHSHFMPVEVAKNTTFYKVHWSDVERQLSLMDEFGIEKSLLLYPTSDAHIQMGCWSKLVDVYNPAIAGIVKKHKGRFVGAGILPIDSPSQVISELKKIEDLGLKVISLASSYEGKYLDEEIFYSVYEFASKKKIPIHVHSQIMNPIGEDRVKDPLLTPVLEYVFDVSVCIGKMMMNETFLRFPNANFIFAHYGGVLPLVKERFDNTYQMLRKRGFVKDIKKLPSEYFQNLFFDMSGSKSLASLLCALEITDVDHILWGSDFPANQNMKDSISFLKSSSISLQDQQKIFSENFLQLLS